MANNVELMTWLTYMTVAVQSSKENARIGWLCQGHLDSWLSLECSSGWIQNGKMVEKRQLHRRGIIRVELLNM